MISSTSSRLLAITVLYTKTTKKRKEQINQKRRTKFLSVESVLTTDSIQILIWNISQHYTIHGTASLPSIRIDLDRYRYYEHKSVIICFCWIFWFFRHDQTCSQPYYLDIDRQNCGFYHIYMIFDVTMGTVGKYHWVLKFVRMTTKYVQCSKLTPVLNST